MLKKQKVATLFLNDSSEFRKTRNRLVVPDFEEFLSKKMLGGNTLMKTIFRVLMLGIMISAVSAVSVFAQDVCAEVEAKQALYKQFTVQVSEQ